MAEPAACASIDGAMKTVCRPYGVLASLSMLAFVKGPLCLQLLMACARMLHAWLFSSRIGVYSARQSLGGAH